MLIGLVAGSFGILIVALAPSVPAVLLGWCVAQVGFNALLAAMAAVLPDQVPAAQRGTVAGILGICVPVASVIAAALITLLAASQLAVFMVPCGIAAVFTVLFAITMKDSRESAPGRWSLRDMASSVLVNPRVNPDFGWVFVSRFLLVLAYAFLTTFLAYYLLAQLHSTEREVPAQILLGTVVQSAIVVLASVAGGKLSDRARRRKIFVIVASVIYGIGMFVLALAGDVTAYLVAMGIAGLGFGLYLAVDLALVVDVLPRDNRPATHMGILNIAGALPSSIAPAVAPAILLLSGGSYAALYAVAGVCALLGAAAVLPIRGAR